MVDEVEHASWWTPSGWKRAPEPTPYNKRVGYTDLELSAESSSAVEYNIYQNDDGHLYVTMQGNGEPLATFFVSAEDAAAFWVDKYPAMINASAGFERRLLKTLVAFVRHGHGGTTINGDGTESLDDQCFKAETRRLWAATLNELQSSWVKAMHDHIAYRDSDVETQAFMRAERQVKLAVLSAELAHADAMVRGGAGFKGPDMIRGKDTERGRRIGELRSVWSSPYETR
jgi:hypothetical protein